MTAYRKIRPNPVEEQFMASIMQIVNEAKAAARANESKSEEIKDNSTGSETPAP